MWISKSNNGREKSISTGAVWNLFPQELCGIEKRRERTFCDDQRFLAQNTCLFVVRMPFPTACVPRIKMFGPTSSPPLFMVSTHQKRAHMHRGNVSTFSAQKNSTGAVWNPHSSCGIRSKKNSTGAVWIFVTILFPQELCGNFWPSTGAVWNLHSTQLLWK